MIVDFDDVKKEILKNHDIDSCIEYLKEAFKDNLIKAFNETNKYATAKREGLDVVAKSCFSQMKKFDELADIADEGIGEAFHYTGLEQHEFIAEYVFMVAPDNFEDEIEAYKQESANE